MTTIIAVLYGAAFGYTGVCDVSCWGRSAGAGCVWPSHRCHAPPRLSLFLTAVCCYVSRSFCLYFTYPFCAHAGVGAVFLWGGNLELHTVLSLSLTLPLFLGTYLFLHTLVSLPLLLVQGLELSLCGAYLVPNITYKEAVRLFEAHALTPADWAEKVSFCCSLVFYNKYVLFQTCFFFACPCCGVLNLNGFSYAAWRFVTNVSSRASL